MRGADRYNPYEAEINRAMLNRSRRKIVVADHSKFDVAASWMICPVSGIDMIITDTGAADEAIGPFLKAGIEV